MARVSQSVLNTAANSTEAKSKIHHVKVLCPVISKEQQHIFAKVRNVTKTDSAKCQNHRLRQTHQWQQNISDLVFRGLHQPDSILFPLEESCTWNFVRGHCHSLVFKTIRVAVARAWHHQMVQVTVKAILTKYQFKHHSNQTWNKSYHSTLCHTLHFTPSLYCVSQKVVITTALQIELGNQSSATQISKFKAKRSPCVATYSSTSQLKERIAESNHGSGHSIALVTARHSVTRDIILTF